MINEHFETIFNEAEASVVVFKYALRPTAFCWAGGER